MSEDTATYEPTEIEAQAMDMGWKPKDQLDDGKEFVDAKEFIARKPLFDRIHAQNEKIKDVEKTLQETSKHILKVQELAYKRAMSDLQKDRRAALKESDVERINEIDHEMTQLQADKPEPTAPPEYIAWEAENKWFREDEELFAFACANFDAQMKKNPNNDIAKALATAARATKLAYPEKFDEPVRSKPEPANVEGGTKPVHQSKQPGYSSLNEAQRRVCDNFVRKGIMTKDAYIRSLHELGEI